ncbi:DUF3574 domain-containing protein [Streptantibioticus ferralitis]|uniref:DUF3574 domain-containing protein n=1 Tax=Streptantibioticus ferralitis TaxID=236510 RepID=A0ABT5YXS0_9ACTN|nr:DUF3574 domain-containing protein [Streptantibioticus ferralitis]MDF2256111.1 DUF3574 domain-containing protein [Streptantibioticus ferralitis]
MPISKPRLYLAALTATIALVALGAATPAVHAALGSGGCAPAVSVQRGDAYIDTRLFFGTGRHNGEPPVTDQQFLAFIAQHVTPHFGSGLTIQKGRGQWRDRFGSINHERSYELILLYPAAEAHARDADIEEIRTAYKRAYGMESVGRADEAARVNF